VSLQATDFGSTGGGARRGVGKDGSGGLGESTGAGVVDEEVSAVGGSPDPDAGEGLSDLPSAVGLDPVGEPGEGSEVPDRGLSRWSAVVGVEVGMVWSESLCRPVLVV